MRRYTISLDEAKHAPIIAWLDGQENVSAAVRQLLERHLAGSGGGAGVDLNGIRQIIEAALDAKLAGLSLPASPNAPVKPDALSAFDDLLD